LKELIEKLIGAVPLFGRLMVALLRAPKTAVLEMDLESDSALQQAFTFLAVSFGVSFLGQIFLLPEKQEKEVLFGILAVQSVLAFALNVLLVGVVWKIVGGKLEWKKIVAASCYFSGVSTVIFLAFSLVAAGAFKMLDPVAYQQVMTFSVTDFAELQESGGYRIFIGLLAAGAVATLAWILVVWGAYREMMQVSKTRSAIALLLFVVLSPILLAVQMLMGFTIAMTRSTPAVPTDLVGEWQATSRTDADGVRTVKVKLLSITPAEYKMLPTGQYIMTDTSLTADSNCVRLMSLQDIGRIAVHESTIELIPQVRSTSSNDRCTGKTTETHTPVKGEKAEYQYRIDQQPAGWMLCLNNRFGPMCLTPKR
jgi:hypothetical protein